MCWVWECSSLLPWLAPGGLLPPPHPPSLQALSPLCNPLAGVFTLESLLPGLQIDIELLKASDWAKLVVDISGGSGAALWLVSAKLWCVLATVDQRAFTWSAEHTGCMLGRHAAVGGLTHRAKLGCRSLFWLWLTLWVGQDRRATPMSGLLYGVRTCCCQWLTWSQLLLLLRIVIVMYFQVPPTRLCC